MSMEITPTSTETNQNNQNNQNVLPTTITVKESPELHKTVARELGEPDDELSIAQLENLMEDYAGASTPEEKE